MDKKKENGAPVNYMQYLQVKTFDCIWGGLGMRSNIMQCRVEYGLTRCFVLSFLFACGCLLMLLAMLA